MVEAIKQEMYSAGLRRMEARRVRDQNEAERERKRQQEIAAVSAEKEAQRGYYTALLTLGAESFAEFEALPKRLMNTEELLDQAEGDFAEGVFAPFWDSVEKRLCSSGGLMKAFE